MKFFLETDKKYSMQNDETKWEIKEGMRTIIT